MILRQLYSISSFRDPCMHVSRGMESAAFALWHVTSCGAGERALRAHARELACCALSEHAQANNVAALLSRLQ